MKRLIIDCSSILKRNLFAGQEPDGYAVDFEGKVTWINAAPYGYNSFMTSYKGVLITFKLVPNQTVLVLDGKNSRSLRQQIHPGYKGKRKPGPPEQMKEYYAAQDMLCAEIKALGGMVVYQDGMEADDVIAYLSLNLQGEKLIWCNDKDMLALHSETTSTDVLFNSDLNPQIHPACPNEYVLVYKALVGDSSDNFPGASGFGAGAFDKMVLQYGFEALPMMEKLLESNTLHDLEEDIQDFKPFKKVVDAQADVYMSYACAKFYPEKINTYATPLKIEMAVAQVTDHKFRQYWQTKSAPKPGELNSWILEHLWESPIVGLDIETTTGEESDAWVKALMDRQSNKKKTIVDVFGSELVGLSLTFGSNLQHTVYLPVNHVVENIEDLDDLWTTEQVAEIVGAIPEATRVIIHNSAFENSVLYNEWGVMIENVWDTLLMKSQVDENTSLGLKFCSETYLGGYKQTSYEEVTSKTGLWGTLEGGVFKEKFEKEISPAVIRTDLTDPEDPEAGGVSIVTAPAVVETWERRQYKMDDLMIHEVLDYACDDAICCSALYLRFLFTMELEKTLDGFVLTDLPAQYWVTEAFIRGVDLNWAKMEDLKTADLESYDKAWKVVRAYLMKVGWPGCEYIPFPEVVTPAAVKEAFKTITGKDLDTRVRRIDKVIDEVIKQADGNSDALDLAGHLIEEDIAGIDDLLLQYFNPEPDFDANKTAHLVTLMFDTMGLPIRFRRPATDKMRAEGRFQGNVQADFAAVEHALKLDLKEGSEEHACLLAIREMKAVKTRFQLYYEPYPLLRHWKDGKLHPSLGQDKTSTRRFAPSGPNINQLPKRKDGGRIRSLFEAPPGYLWASFDWSGQELVLAAEYSGDEMLTSCYVGDNKRDPHSLTGAGIALKQGSEFGDYLLFEAARAEDNKVVKKFRDQGKGVNFSSQYLCQAPKLAKLLVEEVHIAQQFLDAKNEVYWGLAQWQQDVIAEVHATGFVTEMMGGRRHLYDKLQSAEKFVVLEAERQAVNFKIQGSGGSMAKMSINQMHRTPAVTKLGTIFAWPVHDEADVFVQIGENAADCLLQIHACMVRKYANMKIPMTSELSIGRNFGELTVVGKNPTKESIELAIAKL